MSDANPGLMTIFAEALEQPNASARAVYLERACGGDAALRGRVEALLAAHAGAGHFLEPAARDATGTFAPEPTQPAVGATSADAPGEAAVRAENGPGQITGQVIAGRYTLVEIIGEGGMGSVYRAEQTEPVKRPVALKLIKAGMDSKAVLARFDAERQALALMDHPNIARVYDGGTTELGQPFFVMELVQGVPLTQYCDQHRLSVKARLALFVPVCQAVQHAHQKGIIHRDLKPGNVLVTEVDGRPTPKVIDFGVAKATELKLTDLSYADTGAIVGTPAYMSPEQADPSSMDIDTRTDVYALGVMLYELLVGSPPLDAKQFKRGALLEMLRMVREVDPPKPSTKLSAAENLPNIAANRDIEPARLAKSLRGELDWVVMKALEKDRTRRYNSANAFARDLQRYLADEVVEARPPSAGYRLRKFVRRHKGQVIAASLVLLTLIGGMVSTSLGLVQAKRSAEEERIAKAAAQTAAEGEKQAREAERERADELNYRLGVSEMVLASAAYDNRDVKLAAERLDKVPAEQRGWEWRYLKRQVRGGIFTLHGHKGVITSVAFSPDGTRIVTGAGKQYQPFEAKVWDAHTGMFLFDLKGLPQDLRGVNIPVVSVAFSPDSTRIVTAGGDKTARVWDASTGTLQLELKEQAGRCAAFSPDGARIVTADAGAVRVWDARTGKALLDWKAHRFYVTRVAFSPDGSRILTSGADQAVKVWDAGTGTLLLDAKGMISPDSGVAFSPDGKRIVAGREDGKARVIDVRTGTVLLELKGRPHVSSGESITRGVLSVAFSPDGTRIVAASTTSGLGAGGWGAGETIVWDARTGEELLELKGHTGLVMSASFSPDGLRIITGSSDGTAKVWDARSGTPRLQLDGIKHQILSAVFTADGKRLITGGGDPLQNFASATIWDAQTGMPRLVLQGIKGMVHSVAFSPDDTRIVTGSSGEHQQPGAATVWDARTGQHLVELKGLQEGVTSVAFSPDGERIVTGGGDEPHQQGNEVKVWDARTGTLLLDLTQPHPEDGFAVGARVSVALSPDGTRIVVGGARSMSSLGREAKVWDARTGKLLFALKGVKDVVLSVAFSKDGTRIATGRVNSAATIWNAETGEALIELKGHTAKVTSVAFSPDGRRIVTGSGDRTVRVWDTWTGATLTELKGHTGAVTSVSFSADGARILSASGGTAGKPGEVFVWDAPLRTQPVELKGHTDWIHGAVFSPDGTRIATGSEDRTVKVWDARTGSVLLELKGFGAGVNCLAFSADGTRLVTGDDEPTVKVWDARAGTEIARIKFETGNLRRVAFAIDGTRIVTETLDNITKVWDARTFQELKREAIPPTVPAERISPDGRFFAQLNANRVEVIPLIPDEEEVACRRRHTQPNQPRFRAGYLAAHIARDDFAVAFYLNLVPPDERMGLVAQADAEVLADLTKLADEHVRARNLDEAVPLLSEILNVKKARLGAEDPATIQAMDRLGWAFCQAGQFDKAVPLLEGVLKARKSKPGPAAPQTLKAMGMLGLAYKEAGRLKEAMAVLEEGAAKDPWVRQNLLDVYALAGEHAKVVALCLEQLAEVRKARPEDSSTQTDLLARLGRAYLAQMKWSEAEPHLRECLAIREKVVRNAWRLFEVQSLLGGSLLGQKKYAEAEPLLRKGYEGLKQWEKALEPVDAPRVVEALDRLIELSTATNKPDEVKKYRAERAKYPTEQAPPAREKK